jgi:hypothetical protein
VNDHATGIDHGTQSRLRLALKQRGCLLDQPMSFRQRRTLLQNRLPRLVNNETQRTHGLSVPVPGFKLAAITQQSINTGKIA